MARGPGVGEEASACSQRPPAVPDNLVSPGGLGSGEEATSVDPSWVQGELGGPGQLLPQPPAASSTRGAAAKAHPVSVLSALKHGQAPSSPMQCAVLCERAISHTRAPACMLRMRAEANTDTGTNISSFRNMRALGRSYLPPCACVQKRTQRA